MLPIILGGGVYAERHAVAIIQHPLVQHFIPAYRSLKKLPDALFMPVTLFHKQSLPNYYLSIAPKNIALMNAALPMNPFGADDSDDLGEDSKVWVSADFKAGDYEGRVKVRYRGNKQTHWNSYKKSYMIEFPKEHLFQGMRRLSLVIPSDRQYVGMSINNFRARKLGLMVPEESYGRLSLNGADHGVYLIFEQWSQEWIEKRPIASNSTLFGLGDPTPQTPQDTMIYSDEGIPYWKSWNNESLEFPRVEALVELVEHSTDEEFEKFIPLLVDLDQFYARDVVSILAGTFHTTSDRLNASNLVLYFDGTDGRFKPIPYNIGLQDEVGAMRERTTPVASVLARRIWAIPKFRSARDAMFREYVANEKEDDLAYIEDLFKTLTPEFLTDQAKPGSSLEYLAFKKMMLLDLAKYYDDPLGWLEAEVEDFPSEPATLSLPEMFRYLPIATLSPAEFLRTNPGFRQVGSNLYLPRGTYWFSHTIIVPEGTQLTVAPGSTIYMGPDASFISYSPVVAEGTVSQPITVTAQNPARPWGVFGVIRAGAATSTFAYVSMSHGGEATINGVFMSGMLALHNSDGRILSSVFQETTGDDGVNVKGGTAIIENNLFVGNFQDGLDLDFPGEGTLVAHNEFNNNGGDGIDLSWSQVTIDDNIIVGSGDKGISVGERSTPAISGNIIIGNIIGIASKDQSVADARNNLILSNDTAVAAYQKKDFFGGATASVTGGTLWGNRIATYADDRSSIDLVNVSRALPGDLELPSRFNSYLQEQK